MAKVNEIALQMEMMATKPGKLSSFSKTYVLTLASFLVLSTYPPWCEHTCLH